MAERLEAEERQQAQDNAIAQQLLGVIFTNNDVLTIIRATIKAEEGDSAAYAAGIKAMLPLFEVGMPVQVAKLCEGLAVDSTLSEKFLYKKVKTLLETLQLLIKKPDNSFRWATLAELQTSPYAAVKPATDNDQAATSLQRKPLAVVTAACKTALTHPGIIVNAPFVAVRKAQQRHRLEAAKKNPYARVHEDGTIQYLSKPLEGELSEDEKRLIREAAKAEREGQLKAKIEAWKNKDAQTEWRNVQLQASQEQHALVQQFALQAAELRGRREVQREKLKGYLPILMVVGLVAVVGVSRYANDGQTETAAYPALQATVSSPMDEAVLPPMPMEAIEEQPAATPAKGKRHAN